MNRTSVIAWSLLGVASSVVAQEPLRAADAKMFAVAHVERGRFWEAFAPVWPTEPLGANIAFNVSESPTSAPRGTIRLSTSVSVRAKEEPTPVPQPVSTFELTGKEVLASAGTWGDLPRYLQTLPGLIGGSDTQNASFVRGGNSFENLFTVDRIEVPNINHLALANSTGGLGSMLDTEMIGTATFRSGDIGSNFESHLSSLTDIRTTELPDHNVSAFDIGYSGGGFRTNRVFGHNKTLLLSARESVTNLVLKDVGLNGSPEFTNGLLKYTVDFSSKDHIWVDSLGGRDRLKVRPTWNDVWETNAFDTNYSGWRNTTGLVWQHTLRSEAVSTLLLGNSQGMQNLLQTSQFTDAPSLFRQDNSDGTTELKYEYQYADENGSGLDLGFDVHDNRIRYNLQQRGSIYSAYSASMTPMALFSLTPAFSTLDRAAFLDVSQNLRHRILIRSGARFESWGYRSTSRGSSAFLPHASLSVVATKKLNARVSYSRAAQLPPYAIIAGAPGNTSLGLLHSEQLIVGGSMQLSEVLSLNVEAYRKAYSGYPVSVDYPQVSLATLLPSITEPFLTMAMQSTGKGLSHGLEVSVKQNPRHHMFTQANVSFSRSAFTGSDGRYRTGTNDLPFVVNVLGGFEVKRFTVNVRDTMTSGRPYTPILAQTSYDQNRMVYDLSKINAVRGPIYNRLDFAVNRDVTVHGGIMRIHAGILNLLNRENLFEYLWRPRCPVCGPIAENQTGVRPDLNINYAF